MSMSNGYNAGANRKSEDQIIMNTPEANELASYNPTPIVMREVISRIGGTKVAAKILLMGEHGHRTVRAWVSGRLPIPRLCWVTLIAHDRSGEVSV